ncbi:alternative sulfate transporter [Colletotrichum scovillei]|uniref:Alternative sulfate transporter n=2 Tax=Colletotrichum acutatum species complex TaxID=2707335 RepID=A0A9P7U880_9PEZI|nr:alternative sulfate transporter [Colletotrichum scovillei]KAF4775618.1 alternative sulfate transporter [Colletotrichum scovillei]KAG7039032.1 alternative sulfate transporter [Colletotrichum scovillei]KAG7041214.1 alternative sulfate transporter [Colletotrichum scovillei]KAG7061246.1 alternative sulfate transporter [Colletotrichum scovillei]
MVAIVDEKQVKMVAKSPGSQSDSENPDIDWNPEEERQLVRKVDLIIMPLLILAFFALQLDRGNIGNALTDYFLKDVGITQNQFNVGQQLLSAGIVILEIPSNLVLYRIGPTLWIGGQIVAWGLVATFQAFQKGLGAYMVTRILLGLCEAGFIPAALFTMTRWYKRDETSKRFSWFFIGNMLAAACSGLIAYGILHMRGIAGLAGWQWLFLLEGIFTILVGIAFFACFPNQVNNPVSMLGFRYFSEREAEILYKRVMIDDPSKAQSKRSVSWPELRSALTNWRLIPHVIFTIAALAPSSTLSSYAPSLVNSMGFERLESNAMVSVGAWLLIPINLLWGFTADKTRVRGPWVFLGLFIFWGFNLGNYLLIDAGRNARFAMLTLSTAFSFPWHPVNGAWVSANAKSAGERSITMAILIMAANCSGIVGKQLFREEDAPKYRNGWAVIAGLTTAAAACGIWANVQYYILNKRKLNRTGLSYQY